MKPESGYKRRIPAFSGIMEKRGSIDRQFKIVILSCLKCFGATFRISGKISSV